MTLRDYAPGWLRSYAGRTSRGIREATREDYARLLGLDPSSGEPFDPPKGAIAFFGRARLSEIRPRDVKAYAAEVAERGVSRDTVRLALAPLKALLATAVEDDLIDSNPSAGLRFVGGNGAVPEHHGEERAKALTEAELGQLVASTAPEWRLLIEFLVHTGLRPSEALALRWGDIDFGKRRVRVRRSVNRGRVGPPKTRHGRRDVPLSPGMAQSLWNSRKERKAGDDAPVFAGRDGGPLERAAAYRAVKAAAKRASVPWVGLKTLRHSCATLLFRRGLNPKQVQAWLGHHSAAFTLATYVHLLPDDLPSPDFLDAITTGRGADAPTTEAKTVVQGVG